MSKLIRFRIALTILFHSTCAITSTLVSKAALNSLNEPVLLLTLQFTVQVIALTAVGLPLRLIKFSNPISAWRAIIPLTLARVVGILAKTFCLGAVDAAFYQIARGLLLPFTLLLSLTLLRPRPCFPPLSLFGIAIVMLGFFFGLSNDMLGDLTSILGVILGVGSSFTTAVESVVVKRYLTPSPTPSPSTQELDEKHAEEKPESGNGVWQIIWMSNVLSLLILFPLLFLSGQGRTLLQFLHLFPSNPVHPLPATSTSFLPLAFAVGIIGFLLTLATFLQIEVTSPTTHMVVTASRGVAQSGLAMVLLREAVTGSRVASMALILGGSALYGWAKERGLKRTMLIDEERKRDEEGRLHHGGIYVDVTEEKVGDLRRGSAKPSMNGDEPASPV